MPLPPYIIIYTPDNKPLSAPVEVNIDGMPATGSEIYELTHRVYTIPKDIYYQLLYGVDFVRKHEPLRITKALDKSSIPLMRYFLNGTFLPLVEILWYQYQQDKNREQEYFRISLEHVRIDSIKTIMPQVKNVEMEKYNHLEVISFCFQKITWLYRKGFLLYTDIWNNGFFKEEEEKDFNTKKKDELFEDNVEVVENLRITFTEGEFIIPPDGIKFDKKVRVRFKATFNRKPDMRENKVYAKLYAVYNGKPEDMRQIQEGRIVREDGIWETEFILRKPESYEKEKNNKKEADVEYYSVIENQYATNNNYRSASIKVEATTRVYYGGYTLRRGDSDKKKIWGGVKREEEGKYEEELQRDLLGLGYWISNPVSSKHKGMLVDGEFGVFVEKAVKTAQLELLCLNRDGEIDDKKIHLITGIVDKDTARAIKEMVSQKGDRCWYRPGHKPKNEPNVLFYQLPPSEGYYRREIVEYGEADPYFVSKGGKKDFWSFLMVDCWGQKEMIEIIKK
ncbi:MAG: type VI secretion system tube protein Hcp [Chitinispirillaceae bacterium]|nr:type VI secretion system tube protein Hcp [Chitinispirillaceae bacterium]